MLDNNGVREEGGSKTEKDRQTDRQEGGMVQE